MSSGIAQQKRRRVQLDADVRGCLFCLGLDGGFDGEEHVVPRVFGPETDRFVIPPGIVCDDCNHFLGRQVDVPFSDRFDVRLMRALESVNSRKGIIETIEGRTPATALLDLQVGNGKVSMHATMVDEQANGVLFEIRPRQRDPDDIVSRTIRALWKIALGALWMADHEAALDARWDPLRCGILGYPFVGYLLSKPFVVMRTQQISVNISAKEPASPGAMRFGLGGVDFAVPMLPGVAIRKAEIEAAGWEVHASAERASNTIRLWLDTTYQSHRSDTGACRQRGIAAWA